MLLLLLMALMVSKVELEVLLMMISSATATTLSLSPAKELIEEILMIEMEVTAASCILPRLLPLDSLLAMLIIDLSLLGIRESLIGICNLLELCLRPLRVMLVLVWMKLNGHLLESLLNLLLTCSFLQPEQLIVVLCAKNQSRHQY